MTYHCLLSLFLVAVHAEPTSSTLNASTITAPAEINHSTSADHSIEVIELAFATAISSKTPVGRATEFNESVGQVYFWNRIKADRLPTKVKHVWYYNNKTIGETEIPINYNRTRVWTRRRVKPGQWRVDVVDEDGNPLTIATFPVQKAH